MMRDGADYSKAGGEGREPRVVGPGPGETTGAREDFPGPERFAGESVYFSPFGIAVSIFFARSSIVFPRTWAASGCLTNPPDASTMRFWAFCIWGMYFVISAACSSLPG